MSKAPQLFAVSDQVLIGLGEVASRTRLAHSAILYMVGEGRFPEPDRRVGGTPMWNPDRIKAWMIGKEWRR